MNPLYRLAYAVQSVEERPYTRENGDTVMQCRFCAKMSYDDNPIIHFDKCPAILADDLVQEYVNSLPRFGHIKQ